MKWWNGAPMNGPKHSCRPQLACWNAITKARVNHALSELAEGNIDNVQRWLEQVGERSPAEAVRLYMELLEFTSPRLKAANIVANLTPNADGQRRLNEMTMEELQNALTNGG